MPVTAKICPQGQITVPVQIRRVLDVKEGDSVGFEVSNDGRVTVIGIKKRTISSIIGLLPVDHDLPDIGTLREYAAEELLHK